MTTSWSHFVRGQWVNALQANPGGALLALLASISSIHLFHVACSGRAMASWSVNMFAIGMIAALMLAATDWIWRLVSA
ncbi:MAG: hypothetical protein R3C05_25415 [Pirellulaceae bacterium]